MHHTATIPEPWQLQLATLNTQQHWNLSPAACTSYLTALCAILSPDCTPERFTKTCINYHNDHALVNSLANGDPNKHLSREWLIYVLATLRSRGVAWAQDTAIDSDDLVQNANLAIIKSLPTFKYQSQFTTWAHLIIVRSAYTTIRPSTAAKRTAPIIPLDATTADEIPINESEQPEQYAEQLILSSKVITILRQEKGERYAMIFALSIIADQPPDIVAQQVGLSPSRVRALLREASLYLRAHPEVRGWGETGGF